MSIVTSKILDFITFITFLAYIIWHSLGILKITMTINKMDEKETLSRCETTSENLYTVSAAQLNKWLREYLLQYTPYCT